MLAQLEISLDVNIIPIDLFALTDEVTQEPGYYSLKNATHPCYAGFVEGGHFYER